MSSENFMIIIRLFRENENIEKKHFFILLKNSFLTTFKTFDFFILCFKESKSILIPMTHEEYGGRITKAD